MCLAVKDQHGDIREWILHHRNIGAGKFYIFDNNSTTPMLPVMADLVNPLALCFPLSLHAVHVSHLHSTCLSHPCEVLLNVE